MRMLNVRTLLLTTVAVLSAAVAIVLWQQYPDDGAGDGPRLSGLPIKAGNGFWPGHFWLSIAQKKGWFVEAGLTVELVDIVDDYYASLTDTAEGRLDTNGFSLFDLIRFRLQGSDLVAVFLGDQSQGIDAVVAGKGIESLSELRGKRVGVEPNSYHEDILDEALIRAGISPSRVTKVDIDAQKAKEALASGQVDAVVTWEPIVGEALKVAGARKVFDTSKISGISPAVRVFSGRFIKQRPDDVQAFVGVWQRTTAFIQEHPDEAFAIVAKSRSATIEMVRKMARADIIMGHQDTTNSDVPMRLNETSGHVSSRCCD
jgi:NitT/TauT family transport system substrate-binding protein